MFKRRFSSSLIVVALVTLCVWLPSLRNDFVEWDDLEMIVQNPRFNPPTWSGAGWYWIHPAWNLYQPLTTTLWAALAKLGWVSSADAFGGHMNPAVFHLAGLLLHLLSTVWLFLILQQAVKNQTCAALGAMLFAIHPIQVEAVVFAGALNNPIAGCLGLLAIWQYLLVTDPSSEQSPGRRVRRWLISSTALVLAMLAKPSAVVFAPVAFVLDIAIHHRPIRRSVASILPWVLLEIPCVIWTRLLQHGLDAARTPVWLRPVVASDAIAFYLRKLFWPANLAIDYGRTPAFVTTTPGHWFLLLVPALLLVLIFVFRKRKPLLAAGIAIWMLAMLPNSGLVCFDFQISSTTADRYIYLSMIGAAVAAAAILASIPRLKPIWVALLLALIIRTESQIPIWRTGEILYRHAIAVNDRSWMAEGNLASVIADRSPAEAASLCQRALAIRNDCPDIWNTLGTILIAGGHTHEAILAFKQANQLNPGSPIFAGNLDRAIKAGLTQTPPSMP